VTPEEMAEKLVRIVPFADSNRWMQVGIGETFVGGMVETYLANNQVNAARTEIANAYHALLAAPVPGLMSEEQVAGIRQAYNTLAAMAPGEAGSLRMVGGLADVVPVLLADRDTLLRLLRDHEEEHPDLLRIYREGYEAGRKAAVANPTSADLYDEIRPCSHCNLDTLHQCYDSGHERDSSDDWARCTVCNWRRGGHDDEHQPSVDTDHLLPVMEPLEAIE
jgi:hypothetical protein